MGNSLESMSYVSEVVNMNSVTNIFDLSNSSDLPEELRSELNAFKRSDFERRLIMLFRLSNQELSLDQLQVGYFRKYGEIKDRRTITAKLYNMCRSDNPAIASVKGKKGVYRLKANFIDNLKSDEDLTEEEF